jgi:hypothetical protein
MKAIVAGRTRKSSVPCKEATLKSVHTPQSKAQLGCPKSISGLQG